MNHQGLRVILYSTYILVNIYAPFTKPKTVNAQLNAMTVLCCLQLSLPETGILEPFSEDLRVPGTFSWPLRLFSTFVGRKAVKWKSMTLYNQKWSFSIGAPVDPNFLFIPWEYKLFLHFNLITTAVIYSLTKSPKIQQQACVIRRWQAQRQVLFTVSNSCPFQSSQFAPSSHTQNWRGWGHGPWAQLRPDQTSPAQLRLPAQPSSAQLRSGHCAATSRHLGTAAGEWRMKNVPLAKPGC